MRCVNTCPNLLHCDKLRAASVLSIGHSEWSLTWRAKRGVACGCDNFGQVAQHSTAQHSTAQHSTAQHSTAQHSNYSHGHEHKELLSYLTPFLLISQKHK